MRPRQLRFVVLGLAFVLSPACKHVALGAGEDARYWRRLSLPSRWTFAPVDKKSFDDFERSIATPELAFRLQSGHLLVAGSRQSGVQSAEYSLLQYAIDPENGKATSVNAIDWNAGLAIAPHRDSPFRKSPALAENVVVYSNRRFSGRGKYVDGYALSPDGNWLAVSSWDGKLQEPNVIFVDPSVGTGNLFLDIYRVSTGKKLTELTGNFVNESPSHLLGQIVWVSDRYLVVPKFDNAGAWLCDVRSSEIATDVVWDIVRPGTEILGFDDEPDISGEEILQRNRS